MKEARRDELRRELIELFSAYAKDPTDYSMKKRARSLHTECGNSGREVDNVMRHAISLLVNIGWDFPEPPKPTREEAENIVYALAARKT